MFGLVGAGVNVPTRKRFFGSRPIEFTMFLIEAAIGWGLLSGAVVVAVLGKFLLAGVVAVVAILVLMRLKRGRLKQ